jgi:endonuclease III related protein
MRGGLRDLYDRLRRAQGHQGWWPGRSAFEICLGAILTQNTAWTNVERALDSLRRNGLLSYRALKGMPPSGLAPFIRASGTFNVKARRVAAFVAFLGREYGGRVAGMRSEVPSLLRQKLLAVPGIGPETADSIALYAAGHPVFVVDAYTRRIFGRLGLLTGRESYEQMRAVFMAALPADAALFNDYHAQIVRLGKGVCRPRPLCDRCPLLDLCPGARVLHSRRVGASRFRRER